MDRREAIQKIEAIIDNGQDYGYWTDAQREALDLAIEALVLHDKYVKALDRMIEGAKEINRFLDEAVKKSDEKHQLTGETSTNKDDAETLWGKGMRSFRAEWLAERGGKE